MFFAKIVSAITALALSIIGIGGPIANVERMPGPIPAGYSATANR